MSAPFSRALAATLRLYWGLTVLISIRNFPGATALRIPSGPSMIAASAFSFVTIEKVKSAEAHTARGESAHFIPRSIKRCALARVRLYPVTLWPLLRRRLTISLPITPSPTKPKLAILVLAVVRNLNWEPRRGLDAGGNPPGLAADGRASPRARLPRRAVRWPRESAHGGIGRAAVRHLQKIFACAVRAATPQLNRAATESADFPRPRRAPNENPDPLRCKRRDLSPRRSSP